MFFKSKWDCYTWLLSHPGWHYGEELVQAGVTSRGMLYIRLTMLEERGLVERRLEPDPPRLPQLPRHQFRARVPP